MHEAVLKGDSDIVRVLLEGGSDPLKRDSRGNDAFELGVREGGLEVKVEFLYDAIRKGDAGLIDRYISLYDEWDEDIERGLYPVHPVEYAISKVSSPKEQLRVISHLLHSNIPLLVHNGRGNTVLHEMVIDRRKDVVRLILKEYPHLEHCTDRDGNTVLHLAVRSGDSRMVRLLLRSKTLDVNHLNDAGKTALELTAGHVAIERLLSTSGALSSASLPSVSEPEEVVVLLRQLLDGQDTLRLGQARIERQQIDGVISILESLSSTGKSIEEMLSELQRGQERIRSGETTVKVYGFDVLKAQIGSLVPMFEDIRSKGLGLEVLIRELRTGQRELLEAHSHTLRVLLEGQESIRLGQAVISFDHLEGVTRIMEGLRSSGKSVNRLLRELRLGQDKLTDGLKAIQIGNVLVPVDKLEMLIKMLSDIQSQDKGIGELLMKLREGQELLERGQDELDISQRLLLGTQADGLRVILEGQDSIRVSQAVIASEQLSNYVMILEGLRASDREVSKLRAELTTLSSSMSEGQERLELSGVSILTSQTEGIARLLTDLDEQGGSLEELVTGLRVLSDGVGRDTKWSDKVA